MTTVPKTSAEATSTGIAAQRVIGRDAGPIGRLFRIASGIAGLIPIIVILSDNTTGEVLAGFAWLAVVAGCFIGLVALLRPWIQRYPAVSAWAVSGLLMLPLLAYPLGLVPEGPVAGIRLYTDLSVLLSGLMGYGGLEFAALPAMVLRYRPVLYSQYNAVDLVERSPSLARLRPLALVASTAAMVGLVWFWIVPGFVAEGGPFESVRAAAFDLNWLFAIVIVVAGLLLATADAAVIGRYRWALAGLLVVFGPGALVGAMPDILYAVIIVIGLVYAVRLLFWRRTAEPAPAA